MINTKIRFDDDLYFQDTDGNCTKRRRISKADCQHISDFCNNSSKNSSTSNFSYCDPVHNCKDLLFEHSQFPVLNIIWYPDQIGNTKLKQASYILRFGKKIIITIILLILKLGIPIWYILMLVKVPAMFNEMSQFPMGELETDQFKLKSSEMLYNLVYTRGRLTIVSYNILVIAIRVAIQALLIFTVEKDLLRCGYWVVVFTQKGTFRSRILSYRLETNDSRIDQKCDRN